MLAIKVETENGQTHARIAPERLRELVHRIGGSGDRFLTVQRIPDIPSVFAQVWHEEGGDYRLEHRLRDDQFSGTNLTDPERVADALTGWARQRDGWDAGLAWEPVDLGPREEIPELAPEVRERAEEFARRMVREGYLGISELVRETVYLMRGRQDQAPLSEAQAGEIVERLWLERLDEQATWTGTTDPDRLEQAFAALELGGIVSREDFTCCRSCGMAEIDAEADGKEGARGFVFFHHQGTESAAEGHGLALYYGAFDESEERTAEIGREVVAALTAAGLSPEWDGSPAKAIEVRDLDWRKRLTG
ncbi:DUF6891 domain-containing protein [Streptomyces sporangiiformans]|uniref:DUF6891 domain-containing protein n=1 Tax=Streptomyces sporangiiformans TaxID=2315329 RepID=A0A505DDG0_9ACTN|nr:hypothetical protein [Streptomyces sporangiiformans]TPQ21774.1 hypothetical protein FGD71_013380 [Streptomyces sporangiiformans]